MENTGSLILDEQLQEETTWVLTSCKLRNEAEITVQIHSPQRFWLKTDWKTCSLVCFDVYMLRLSSWLKQHECTEGHPAMFQGLRWWWCTVIMLGWCSCNSLHSLVVKAQLPSLAEEYCWHVHPFTGNATKYQYRVKHIKWKHLKVPWNK